MTFSAAQETPENILDTTVAHSSSYDLLKKRLQVQGEALQAKIKALNVARVEQFGQSEQQLLMRLRARTENNCVARDLAWIGGNRLVFGHNVFMGLKRATRVEDVFAIYGLNTVFVETANGFPAIKVGNNAETGWGIRCVGLS